MVISDHLNLTGRTPLLGANADELGPRFPDLTDVWAPPLRSRLHDAARAEGLELAEGIYAGLIGPAFETPAEVRMLHTLGRRCGRDVDGARGDRGALGGPRGVRRGLVTNAGAGYSGQPLSHEEVLEAGAAAGPGLARTLRRFIADLPPA